eukprot:gb/GEZN01001398.1/.p1 GENE.gb/GEZN01001398.1/~~gb/GEZN01001398.1/.p1  ORF type:complete len:885 (-),score=75.81 gb/GEZN01001398.1/:423-3011(-)
MSLGVESEESMPSQKNERFSCLKQYGKGALLFFGFALLFTSGILLFRHHLSPPNGPGIEKGSLGLAQTNNVWETDRLYAIPGRPTVLRIQDTVSTLLPTAGYVTFVLKPSSAGKSGDRDDGEDNENQPQMGKEGDGFTFRFEASRSHLVIPQWGADIPDLRPRLGGFYVATLSVPKRELVSTFAWTHVAATISIEVSCSDGVFCNGQERLIAGHCVHSPILPCVYGADSCARHFCNEGSMSCDVYPLGGDICAECGPVCEPDCTSAGGQICGSGGCPVCDAEGLPRGCTTQAFACGTCEADQVCIEVKDKPSFCKVREGDVSSLGTCNNPFPLLGSFLDASDTTAYQVPMSGALGRIKVDSTSEMKDNLLLTCGSAGVVEYVYRFEVLTGQGIEVIMVGQDQSGEGFDNGLDTVLAIHKSPAEGCVPFKPLYATDVACSDDATPPGDVGSRVQGFLLPGEYTIVASFYAQQSCGPFNLLVKFTDSSNGVPCRPACESKTCGVDSCGGYCGLEQFLGLPDCPSPLRCEKGQCSNCDPDFISSPAYVSLCVDKTCGFDQCGLACGDLGGECPSTYACDLLTLECMFIGDAAFCENFAPVCKGQESGRFCGSDCQWHPKEERLIDLIPPPEEEVTNSIVFNTRVFTPDSCAVQECLAVPAGAEKEFAKKLMRFDTNVRNIGASWKPPTPESRPDLFEWSRCHGHYHFENFAGFELFDFDGTVLSPLSSGKLAYCMEDSVQSLFNPDVPCFGVSTCADQGLQFGWTDTYPADLDCQWIDLTNLVVDPINGRWVVYSVCVNTNRDFQEDTFTNNCVKFPVWIPPQVDENARVYKDFFKESVFKQSKCALLTAEMLAQAQLDLPRVCR